MIMRPFPGPPRWVAHALEQLRLAEAVGLQPGGLTALDRPWDPAACTQRVRTELWPWLDDVAGWLNHSYAWSTAHAVPACWPAHSHLVHELAVLACLRLAAGEATSPHALEDWHRHALPGFISRMTERLGAGCPPGRHVDWPGRSWAADYDSDTARSARAARFAADLSEQDPDTRTASAWGAR